MKTIDQLLAKYGERFRQCYKDCHNIEEIEGQTLTGTYGGYRFTPDDSSISYFTEAGIRGISHGTFMIKNGVPEDVPEKYIELKLKVEEIKFIYNLLDDSNTSRELKIYLRKFI